MVCYIPSNHTQCGRIGCWIALCLVCLCVCVRVRACVHVLQAVSNSSNLIPHGILQERIRTREAFRKQEITLSVVFQKNWTVNHPHFVCLPHGVGSVYTLLLGQSHISALLPVGTNSGWNIWYHNSSELTSDSSSHMFHCFVTLQCFLMFHLVCMDAQYFSCKRCLDVGFCACIFYVQWFKTIKVQIAFCCHLLPWFLPPLTNWGGKHRSAANAFVLARVSAHSSTDSCVHEILHMHIICISLILQILQIIRILRILRALATQEAALLLFMV